MNLSNNGSKTGQSTRPQTELQPLSKGAVVINDCDDNSSQKSHNSEELIASKEKLQQIRDAKNDT